MATIYRSISLAQAAFFARANSSLVILPQLLSMPFQSDSAFISFRTPRSAFRIRMIPREILKKIRQIEIRTNRPVSETLVHFGSGERARPGRSQRRPRRWHRCA